MKITEIISSPELNEGLGSMAWDAGAKLLGAGAGSSKEAIAKLGAKWADEIATHGKPVTAASEVVGDKWATNPSVLKNAEKEANNIRKGAETAANKAAVKGAIANAASMVNKTAGLVSKLTALGISTAAVLQYNRRMDAWQHDLDNNDITQDQFELARRQELAVMISQIALSLGTYGAARSLTALLPGTISKGLSAYGMYKMGDYLMTNEGRQTLATVLVNEYYDLTPILGGVPAKMLDKIKSMVPGFNNDKSSGQPGQGNPGGQSPSAAPSGTTTDTAYKTQPSQNIPGSNLTSTNTGPNSFDIGWQDVK